MSQNSRRSLHIIETLSNGGVGKAGSRINECINDHFAKNHYYSSIYSTFPHGNKPAFTPEFAAQKSWIRLRKKIAPFTLKFFPTTNTTIRTLAWPRTLSNTYIDKLTHEFDIINIHWLGNSSLTVKQVDKIASKIPVVWTMHDQWAFLGSEHYQEFNKDVKFLKTSEQETRKNNNKILFYPDIDRIVFAHKKRTWQNKFGIICPSRWMQKCVQNSELMHEWNTKIIPNPINTNFWKPLPKQELRSRFGISQDQFVILFGATGGSSDPRKGYDLLEKSLLILASQLDSECLDKITIAVFGSKSEPCSSNLYPFRFINLGILTDEKQLRNAYNIANLFILPSRLDNLPNTGVEAHATGLPIIAFNTGGLEDVVSHNDSGFLAKPFDVSEICHYLKLSIRNPDRLNVMAQNARKKAKTQWNYETISSRYTDFYNTCIDHYNSKLVQ